MGGAAVELAILLTAKDAASGVLTNVAGKFNALGTAGKLAAAGAAVLATAAAGVVTSLVALANKSAQTAGEVTRLKREMGVTSEEASKLRYIGERLNISTDDLSKSFGILSKSLESAHPSLAKYNITVIKAKDGHVDMEATLGKVADRFKSMPDGVEKTALALDIFGKSGKDMIPLLNQGSDGLKSMGDEAKKLGLVFDDTALNSAKRYGKAQKDIGDAVEGLKNKLGMAFLPVLADVAMALSSLASSVLPPVMAWINALTGFVRTAVGVFGDMRKAVDFKMVGGGDFLGSLIGPASAANFMQLLRNISAEWKTLWIFRIRPAIEWAQANIPVIWEKIKTAISDAWTVIEPKLKSFADKLGELKDKFEALPAPVKKAIEEVALVGVVMQVSPINDWINSLANAAQGVGGLTAAAVALKGKWVATLVAIGTTAAVLVAIASVVVAVYQIASAIGEIRDHWENLRKAVHDGSLDNKGAVEDFLSRLVTWGDMFDALGTKTHDNLAIWQGWFQDFGRNVQGIWPSIVLMAQLAWTGILIGIQGMVNGGIDAINELIKGFRHIPGQENTPLISHITIDLPNVSWAENQLNSLARDRTANVYVNNAGHNINPQASGGDYMVNRPTLFLAGEAGPERATFTPIGKSGGGGGGGITFVFNAPVVGLSKTELADELSRVFTQARRLQGLSS